MAIKWLSNIYEDKNKKLHAEAYCGGIEECTEERDLWVSLGARVLAFAVPIKSPTFDDEENSQKVNAE